MNAPENVRPALDLRLILPDRSERTKRVAGGSIRIGRATDCELTVADRSISRYHARFFMRDQVWWIEDLDSRNGTYVNGVQIRAPQRIAPNSTISLGGTHVVIEGGPHRDGIAPAEPDLGSGKHTRFVPAARVLESMRLDRQELEGEQDPLRRVAERLELLNEVHQALARPWSLQQLLELILDRVFEHLHPEQAAIFLHHPTGGARCVASRSEGEESVVSLYSRSLLREVAEKGQSALVLDARTDSRFSQAQSLVTTGVRSLAAAPLLDPDGPLGMIVVGSRLHVRQFEEEDMELLTSLASVAAMRIRNVRLAEEAAERRRLQREVALARRIQEALLPETLPEVPGWELWGVTVPSRGVSGDMFKVVRREDGCIVLLLADVSGKGMGASLLTASLEALTAVPIQDGYPPGKVFRWAGRLLHDRTPPEKYATAFLGVLDPEEGELVWCNAGHPPGLILEPRGSCRRLGTTGIPLGLFADADYGEQTGTVERGETLVLYSDGVTEAARDGEELGVDGLERICSANLDLTAQELGSAISGELERFAGEGAFADDRTLIVARRLC